MSAQIDIAAIMRAIEDPDNQAAHEVLRDLQREVEEFGWQSCTALDIVADALKKARVDGAGAN